MTKRKRNIFSRIFLKELNYEDGSRKVRLNLLSILLILLTLGAVACALLSGWTCGGCEKKPLNIRDVRGALK